MLNLEYFGEPLTHEKIVPGNTATSLSENCYNYMEYDVPFDSGGVATPVVGDYMIGATGGAQFCIVSITLDATTPGTWAGGDAAGVMRVKSYRGTALVNNEILNLAGVNTATVDGVAHKVIAGYDNFGRMASVALIVVYAQTALISLTGNPDQSSLIGVPMPANSSLIIRDINTIKNMKVIDYTSGSASNVQVTYYF